MAAAREEAGLARSAFLTTSVARSLFLNEILSACDIRRIFGFLQNAHYAELDNGVKASDLLA